MTDGHLPTHWRERFLHLLIAPFKPETMRFLDAWARAEGGSATNNPLNSTYPLPWTPDYNSVGVKNYRSPIEGISANAITLARETVYRDLWKDLQNGSHSAEEIVNRNASAIRHWGTNTELILRILAE